MSVLTIDEAKAQSRIDDDADDVLIQGKLDAAESMAAQFMGRYVYANDADLIAGLDQVKTILENAKSESQALIDGVSDDDKPLYQGIADQKLYDARRHALMISNGKVINPHISAGILLIFGYLYENREDDGDLPQAAKNVLQPYRVNLGV
ncbi:head-tail connector protein [Acinetobacter puyangensis]|uniref:head-tail connector protein n=1 Tax=Acinetobacter puyangensis TaxID=1096779 RepID=UPI003A4E1DAC